MWIRMSAILALVLATSTMAIAQDEQQQLPEPTPEEVKEKASYVIGFQIGSNLQGQGLELSLEQLIKGMTNAMNGEEIGIEQAELVRIMQAFEKQAMAAQEARMAELEAEMKKEAAENLAKGKAFLEANAKKEGVVVLDSGLQYKVLKEGAGDSPKVDDIIKAHYKGTFIDGEVFDQSEEGMPIEIPVGGVIRGWVEALQKMKVGSKWELYIPADLGYGERGGPGMPPNSTLVFEVELVEILKPNGEIDK